jgi:hypothetical protein
MPSQLAWGLMGVKRASFEVLFPDEAARFQVYDEEKAIYRILLVHCEGDDLQTNIFQFERTDEINLDKSPQELAPYCDESSIVQEVEHSHGFLIDTYHRPGVEIELFVGHQAVLSVS